MFQENDRVISPAFGIGHVIAVNHNDELPIYVQFYRLTAYGYKFWVQPSEIENLDWLIIPESDTPWTQSAQQSSN